MILSREFERGFNRLRTAAGEVDAVQFSGRDGGQFFRQGFGGGGGEEARVRVGDFVQLLANRRRHRRVGMPQTRDGRAAATVQITLAVLVNQMDAVAADNAGQGGTVRAGDDESVHCIAPLIRCAAGSYAAPKKAVAATDWPARLMVARLPFCRSGSVGNKANATCRCRR